MDLDGNTNVGELQGMLFSLDPLIAEASNSNTNNGETFTLPGSDVELNTGGDDLYGRATMLECRLLASILETPFGEEQETPLLDPTEEEPEKVVGAEAKRLADRDPSALLDHRRRLRASKSADLISRLALWKEAQVVLPETKLARAVGFLDNHWERLTRFLAVPHIPLDNGESERAIRRPVLGRKNFYGTRSDRGARVAAALFSLLGTCTKLGVEPGDYLLEATKRALRDPGTVYLPKDHLLEQSADSTE